ncbi:hypothetical protein BT96DRAFT_431583 [Gymnopus androsaceus JB14]|uniref:Coenzyme Q-binding protein COQ10 START domain-containing protein n=1 Tax=Gymnopus androsaceus JB14 TaxID=1447944 RepID=A0A6A4GS41_9AGAR|nr:hypothetical protein BT96DRAFT_431583 [Gymnopus androsaceus JB14]
MSEPSLSSSGGVFPVYTLLEFDAPITAEDVWNVLMDFESYGSWNPFIREQTFLSSSKDQPKPGQQMLLTVHTPPQLSDPYFLLRSFQVSQTVVQLKVVDHENHRLAWRTTSSSFPEWFLWCERWQMITANEKRENLNDSDAKAGCKYESYEVFGGLLAYVMWILCVKVLLLRGVVEMAEALKKRTEKISAFFIRRVSCS